MVLQLGLPNMRLGWALSTLQFDLAKTNAHISTTDANGVIILQQRFPACVGTPPFSQPLCLAM